MLILSSALFRKFLFLLGIAAIFGGSIGCATMAASSASKTTTHTPPVAILSDEIFALGPVDEAEAQKIGQGPLVAFLGYKQTYLLNQGGKELLDISGQLDGKRLKLQPIEQGQLLMQEKHVWGRVSIDFDGGDGVSDDEARTLKKLGFFARPVGASKTVSYRKSIQINGFVYPPTTLTAEQMRRFAHRYPITLYQPGKTEEHFNPAGIVLLPVGVAVDLLLSPVYLGVILAVSANH